MPPPIPCKPTRWSRYKSAPCVTIAPHGSVPRRVLFSLHMSLRDVPDVSALPTEPVSAARSAGLRYVSDDHPGFSRERAGKASRFLDSAGKELRNPEHLARIKSLAIPPAWTDVWICPITNGHLQATGRDARGRKQHRYHPRWREARDETKFTRMIAFARVLPKIRKRIV